MGRLVVVLFLLVAAGCVDAGFVPCGTNVCPEGSVCLAGSQRCVTPDQLAECAQREPGDDCIVGTSAGKCVDGACTPISCGNGVLEPGEICDDGNRLSGDGCDGTCTSLETCGNALVDVAMGEGCDCGGPDNASVVCAGPNSADPGAECTADCRLRYCGDGVLNTIEQCDGSVPATATCADFGYYEGELRCSSLCRLDPVLACTRRCGDGVIDDDHGEWCDQAVSSGESCLAFGADLGTLGCTSTCAPKLTGCFELGFSRAHSVQESVLDLWGGGGRIAVVYASGSTYVRDVNGAWNQATGTYALVAGTPTTIWAAGPAVLARWSATTKQWTPETPPWPSTATVQGLWASDQVGLFAILSDGTIHRRGTTNVWQTDAAAWPATARFGATTSTPYLVYGTGAMRWNGSSWVAFTPTGITSFDQLGEEPSGRLWIGSGTNMYMQNGTSWRQFTFIEVQAFAPDAAGMFAFRRDVLFNSPVPFIDTLQLFATVPLSLEAPAPIDRLASDGAGTPYVAFGTTGLYRIERGGYMLQYVFSYGVLASAYQAQMRGGPLLSFASGFLQRIDLNGSPTAVTMPESCDYQAVIAPSGTLYCSAGTGRFWIGNIQRNLGGGGLIWVAQDEQTVAVGGSKFFAFRRNGNWTNMNPPPTFDILELAGDAVDDLYAVGYESTTDTMQLWHFNGTAWTAKSAAEPWLGGLLITPTAVYTALQRTNGLLVYNRQTQQTSIAPTPVAFSALAGTSATDLFGGARGAGAIESPLWHFDGVAWSPVRTTANIVEIARLQMVDNTLLVFGPVNAFFQTGDVYWLYRNVAW